VAAWRYRDDDGDSIRDAHDIQRRVKEYHPHSFLQLPDLSKLPHPRRKAPSVEWIERQVRRPPEFAHDERTCICTVRLFTFAGVGLVSEEFTRRILDLGKRAQLAGE
jgi:hypothetical protein